MMRSQSRQTPTRPYCSGRLRRRHPRAKFVDRLRPPANSVWTNSSPIWLRGPSSPEPPAKLTPEEIQQQLNEAFAGVLLNGGTPRTPPEPRIESPGPSLSSEELQQHLNEHFGNSRPRLGPTLSPRRIRSLFRAGNPATGGPSRRQRCDARVKNLFRIGKNGVGVAWPLLQRLGDGERSLLGAWRRVDGSEDPRGQGARRCRDGRGAAQVGCATPCRGEEIPCGPQARREMGGRTDARARPRRSAQA